MAILYSWTIESSLINDQNNSIIEALVIATSDRAFGSMDNYSIIPPDGNNDLYVGWWADVAGFNYDWYSRMRIYGDGNNKLGVVD